MLTFAETCGRLRLTPKTVRKLIVSGELKAAKLGDAANSPVRVDEADLDDYIARRKAASAQAS